jgi:tetratricopeptide (TPR) repeat protein
MLPKPTYAQEAEAPTDDLGDVSDAFQENFFEALKQKGIENYELALEALKKASLAAKGNTENIAVVNFEMGKNLALLKQYEEAESKFKQVLESTSNKLEVMESLYDVYYQQRNYEAAIPLVQQLIKFDPDYKEDLANLYNFTQQYDKALSLLDELDESWGENTYRDALRRQIYKVTGNAEGAINNLEVKIDKNPKNERDYLNLIFLYSEQGDSEKAFRTAEDLLKQQPNSKLVHLALYKFYLERGETEKALNSMDVVFGANQIDQESKYRVMGDFIGFVNTNPAFESKLEAVVEKFGNENSGEVYEKIGLYFVGKGQKEKALKFYEMGVSRDADNYSLIKNTLLLQIDFKKYPEAAKLSRDALEIFPAQALLYLLNGVAETELSNYDIAIENMETGIDYLFDDLKMEKDFYDRLSIAHDRKGNAMKAAAYRKKAMEINIAN